MILLLLVPNCSSTALRMTVVPLHFSIVTQLYITNTPQVTWRLARIPAEKEVPLWNLLGGYADKLEPFDK